MSRSDDNEKNYASHTWVASRCGGPSDPPEWITYCAVCGIEDLGNPIEFTDIEYPVCEDVQYSMTHWALPATKGGAVMAVTSQELQSAVDSILSGLKPDLESRIKDHGNTWWSVAFEVLWPVLRPILSEVVAKKAGEVLSVGGAPAPTV